MGSRFTENFLGSAAPALWSEFGESMTHTSAATGTETAFTGIPGELKRDESYSDGGRRTRYETWVMEVEAKVSELASVLNGDKITHGTNTLTVTGAQQHVGIWTIRCELKVDLDVGRLRVPRG